MTDKVYELENAFKLLEKDWMLITSKNGDKSNTMTASWGGFGYLWNKHVAYIFIRPQRYTFEFTEKNDMFTLSFFDNDYKNKLSYLGKNSGRDTDKIKETGLTLIEKDDISYFGEAKKVLICKKLYRQQLNPQGFIEEKIDEFYNNDYHIMYIGEIVEII